MLAFARRFAILQPHPTHTKHARHTSHPPLARLQAAGRHRVLGGRSPITEAGDVHMHWPTEDSSTLIYRKGESRCILIASGLGPRAHMYAHLKPCDSKQAVGPAHGGRGRRAAAAAGRADAALLRPRACAAAAARRQARRARGLRAQGGPPARGGHLRGRARGRGAPRDLHGHRREPRQVPANPRVRSSGRAFCEKVCWHSCDGESHDNGMDDGFSECPSESVRARLVPRLSASVRLCPRQSTSAPALTPSTRLAVRRECPPGVHDAIQNVYDTKCALTPPSPPRPPATRHRRPRARSCRRRRSPPPPPPPPAPYFEAARARRRDGLRPRLRARLVRHVHAASSPTTPRSTARPTCCASRSRRARASTSMGAASVAAPTAAQTAASSTTCCPTCSPSSTRPTRRRCRLSELPYCACANQPVALHTRSRRRRPPRTPRTTTRTRRTKRASTSSAAAPRASSTRSRARRRRWSSA